MQNDIFEQLKDLRSVAPDADFAARTKRIILAEPRGRAVWPTLVGWPKVVFGGLATAAVLLLAVILPGMPKTVPIASAEALNNEFNGLSINIELQQISYNQNVNQTIASALSEITTNKLNHLNPAVIQAEGNSLDPNLPASDPQIDALLNQAAD